MKRKVVALTGGIGSGKTAVAEIVRNCGFQTIDCDVLGRIVADMPQTVDAVAGLLGSEYVSHGKLNRALIRERIFQDADLLARYNEIFFDGIRELLVSALQQTKGDVFVEIPILDAFEFPWDEIWLVESDQATRVSRVTTRDGVDADNVLNVIANQKQYDNFTRKIVNNGTLDELALCVKQALIDSGLM